MAPHPISPILPFGLNDLLCTSQGPSMTFDRPGHTGHTGQTPEDRPQQHRQQPKQQRPTLNLAKEREFYRSAPSMRP